MEINSGVKLKKTICNNCGKVKYHQTKDSLSKKTAGELNQLYRDVTKCSNCGVGVTNKNTTTTSIN